MHFFAQNQCRPGSCAAPDIRIQMQEAAICQTKKKISHHRQASAKKPESAIAPTSTNSCISCLRIRDPRQPVYRAKKGDQKIKQIQHSHQKQCKILGPVSYTHLFFLWQTESCWKRVHRRRFLSIRSIRGCRISYRRYYKDQDHKEGESK